MLHEISLERRHEEGETLCQETSQRAQPTKLDLCDFYEYECSGTQAELPQLLMVTRGCDALAWSEYLWVKTTSSLDLRQFSQTLAVFSFFTSIE